MPLQHLQLTLPSPSIAPNKPKHKTPTKMLPITTPSDLVSCVSCEDDRLLPDPLTQLAFRLPPQRRGVGSQRTSAEVRYSPSDPLALPVMLATAISVRMAVEGSCCPTPPR